MSDKIVVCDTQGCDNRVEVKHVDPAQGQVMWQVCASCEARLFRKAAKSSGMRLGL